MKKRTVRRSKRRLNPAQRRKLRRQRRFMRKLKYALSCVLAAVLILLALILYLYFSADSEPERVTVMLERTAAIYPAPTPTAALPTATPIIGLPPTAHLVVELPTQVPSTDEPSDLPTATPVIGLPPVAQPTPELPTQAPNAASVDDQERVTAEFEVTKRKISASSEGTAWISAGELRLAGESMAGVDVSNWSNLTEAALGERHVVAIDEAGRAWAAGDNSAGQCNVDGLEGVVSVSASTNGTIAVLTDGSVRAFGSMPEEWLDGLAKETSVVQADMSSAQLILLKADGSAKVYGDAAIDESWVNLRMVAAGYDYVAALTETGEVLISGGSTNMQQELRQWRGMKYICAGVGHMAGIRSDGSAVAIGRDTNGQLKVENWANIIAIDAGYDHTAGIDADGRAYACGYEGNGQCDVNEEAEA